MAAVWRRAQGQAGESTHRSGPVRVARISLSPVMTVQGQKVRPQVRNGVARHSCASARGQQPSAIAQARLKAPG